VISPLPFLAALVLRLLAGTSLPEPIPGDGIRAPFFLSLAVLAFLLSFEAEILIRNRALGKGKNPPLALRLFHRVYGLGPLLIFGLGLFAWRWDSFVRFRIGPPGEALSEICLFAPWIWSEILLLIGELRMLGRGRLAGPRIRAALIVLPSILCLLAVQDLLRILPVFRAAFDTIDAVRDLGLVFGVLVLAIVTPAWMGKIFGARPLEDPTLLQGCRELARRAGLRIKGVWVLPTRLRSLNAAMVGLFSRSRRFFFTDLLLEFFRPWQVLAVFAHEAAHASRRHVLKQISFFLIFPWMAATALSWWGSGEGGLLESTGFEREEAVLVLFLAIELLMLPLYRRLSHAYEHEADLHGSALCGSRADMVDALQELQRILPASSHKPGLRHPSLASRTAFLEAVEDRGFLEGWVRRIARLQAFCFLLLGMSLGLAIPAYVAQGREGEAEFLLRAGWAERAWTLYRDRSAEDPGRVEAADLDAAMRARLLAERNGLEGPGALSKLRRLAHRRAARSLERGDSYAARGWLSLLLRWGGEDELSRTLYRYLDARLEILPADRIRRHERRLEGVLHLGGNDALLGPAAAKFLRS